jgi:hypothetical protein
MFMKAGLSRLLSPRLIRANHWTLKSNDASDDRKKQREKDEEAESRLSGATLAGMAYR